MCVYDIKVPSHLSCPNIAGADSNTVAAIKPGAQGSLEFSCVSIKFLQGAQKCTCFYTQHSKIALEDATGLPRKKLDFEPRKLSLISCFSSGTKPGFLSWLSQNGNCKLLGLPFFQGRPQYIQITAMSLVLDL